MRWIRWSGLVLFAVIVTLIVTVLTLFLDPVIKSGIEYGGTKAVGAKVEVGQVKTSLLDGAIRIEQLAITNPKQPMSNALEIERALLDVDMMALFSSRVIVDDMQVVGLFVNSPREESGAVAVEPEANDTTADNEPTAELSLPGIAMPSKDDILQSANLKSIDAAKSLEGKLKQFEEQSRQKIAALPDKKSAKAYEERIRALTKGGKDPLAYIRKAKDLKKIRDDIKADLERIKQAKASITHDAKQLKTEVGALKQLAKDDVDNLMAKVGVDDQGNFNIISALFGEKVGHWYKEGMYWYRKLKPYLGSGGQDEASTDTTPDVMGFGRVVHYASTSRPPDFHLKQLHITKPEAQQKAGLLGKASHINSKPAAVAEPMRIDLEGDNVDDIKKVLFNAVIDHRNTVSKDSLKLNLQALSMPTLPVSESSKLPLTIDSSLLDMDSELRLQDEQVDGRVLLSFSEAKMLAPATEGDGSFIKAIKSTLRDVSDFTIEIAISGELDKPSFGIRSNLDDKLKGAASQYVKQKTDALKKDVKAGIDEKIATESKKLEQKLGSLGQLNQLLDGKEKLLSDLLKSQLGKL